MRLALPASVAARLKPYLGQEVTLGIRPEDLRVVSGEATNGLSFEAVVEVVERLGSEILLDLKVGSGSMVAAVEPTVPAKVRERLQLALNPERLHFFTRTEAAI
jgi:multiple sugar transport system ATP-binding protein